MARKLFDWKLKSETIHLGERTYISGVLNVTPDSEFEQGLYMDPDRAYIRAMEIADQGADILEIGAESMRGGSTRISEAEELRRLVPVLKRLRGKVSIPICVETYKPAVAEKAAEHGAAIIKDPSCLTLDADLPKVVAQHDLGLIVQHMRGTPDQWAKQAPMKDAANNAMVELGAAANRAIRAGVMRQRIVVDPGLGLGKRKEANTEIIHGLDRLTSIQFPIQVSPTGKPFASQPPLDVTFAGCVAAATAAVLRGAHILRVHQVGELRAAAVVADQFLRS